MKNDLANFLIDLENWVKEYPEDKSGLVKGFLKYSKGKEIEEIYNRIKSSFENRKDLMQSKEDYESLLAFCGLEEEDMKREDSSTLGFIFAILDSEEFESGNGKKVKEKWIKEYPELKPLK